MRKIKDVMRLKFDAKLSHEQIATALGISKGVVAKYASLAAAAGLDWDSASQLTEGALEARLLPRPVRRTDYVLPDYGYLHRELRRKGMTLMVFHPAWGYFCRDYGLRQVAVEVEGKEPKPAQMKALMARQHRNSADFPMKALDE